MKKVIVFLLVLSVAWSCKEGPGKEAAGENQDTESQEMARKPERVLINDAILEQGVIYEANIRQYSPEGTFNAFTKDIPQLKELGVKVIWLMPIHPISMVKRKATNDSSIEEITDPEERKKYLGSYYSVADYKAVNPEHGTMEDFRELVQTAHDNGMYVIIDWVPNHTGWDHPWITEHPEYYTKNEAGEITDPLNDEGEPWGWTDVADLNYDNMEMQDAMIDAMKFWIVQEGIDGFRCDVAHSVPASFWEKAIPALRAEKNIFMLAEAEIPEIMKDDLFEMSYAWEFHHLLNALAKGESSVADFDAYMTKEQGRWEDNDMLMRFVTNHDENSWAGPVKERMGDASDALLALTYCVKGMPLVYSGQEYDLNHRLKFFEKDQIPKDKGMTWENLSRLGQLKNSYPAMAGGKQSASYERLTSNNDNVLAFQREKGDSKLIYIANLSGAPQNVILNVEAEGPNWDPILNREWEVNKDGPMELAPWEYHILIKK
ncbi:alpha-amylase family glycosyl hydrolase [Aureisphaera galaxeae]|uniref:alpha-amylase family glycosyl hydrolase n=1 Tax=Aureisphaera galaxeae TaxID=1538023 RepID=UPI002350BD17|nr:alpha-amylase family glycosyl hydrolase [Aureisphaera galaxeae]MDC8004761.1 alpha-amylase family glycosyl hydrolase [Aureisphaera galaxeae]